MEGKSVFTLDDELFAPEKMKREHTLSTFAIERKRQAEEKIAEKNRIKQAEIDKKFLFACKDEFYQHIYQCVDKISSVNIMLNRESELVYENGFTILHLLGWIPSKQHLDCVMMLVEKGCKLTNRILHQLLDVCSTNTRIDSGRFDIDEMMQSTTLKMLSIMKKHGVLDNLDTISLITPICKFVHPHQRQWVSERCPIVNSRVDIVRYLLENSNMSTMLNDNVVEYLDRKTSYQFADSLVFGTEFVADEKQRRSVMCVAEFVIDYNVNIHVLKLLIKYGMNVFVVDSNGYDMLYRSSFTCCEDVIMYLLNMYAKAGRYDLITKTYYHGEGIDRVENSLLDMSVRRDYQDVKTFFANMYSKEMYTLTDLPPVCIDLVISYIFSL